MTPIRPMAGAPMHPWTKIALPIAAIAAIGVGAVAAGRATDGNRSAGDRVASGVVGAAALGGLFALGEMLGIRGAGISDKAMNFVRETGSRYDKFAWPSGTKALSRGGATWYTTPHEAIGDALTGASLAGIIGGGLFGGVAINVARGN